MSARLSHVNEQDNGTSEITYQLEPHDVEDILERLHIGTLRREQLKQIRLSAISNDGGEDDIRPLDDQALEDMYKHEGAHSASQSRGKISRQSSTVSVGSSASGSSSGNTHFSRQSSQSSDRPHGGSRRSSTTEMGIQTTLGRSSHGPEITDTNGNSTEHKKERKKSSKDKMKKILRKKSSSLSESKPPTIIPELPQGFIVKYMGKRPTKGLWGSKHTRIHVEEIVESIGHLPKGEDLPLVNFEVHYEGLIMRPHSKNKVKSFVPVQIPIQFISYGLQDTVYPRVFCFIMVKEMSSQKKSMECHVYACDSAKSAHQIAACLAIAFQAYSEKLQESGFKFTINIAMQPEETVLDSCEA